MDVVKEILAKQQLDLQKYKTVKVVKHLECHLDVGTMLCSDPNELNEEELKNKKENYLLELTRDNVQILINSIWELPTERVDECVVAKLPSPTTVLPRLRKPPGPKAMTKWEKFAKEKGIKKKKKEKKTFDEVLDKWVPTYGYRRADAEKQKDWVLEVPKNADPNEDMFQQKLDLRSENVAKNEIKRMRNIVRAKKLDVPSSGYLGQEAASSTQLLTAVTVAKASTASVGKFQDKLPKEKVARGLGIKELIPGAKRKNTHVVDENQEKEANLDLIKSVLNKKPKFDAEKAISLQKQDERLERESMAGQDQQKGHKGKKGKGRKTALGKKPKGNHGQRNPGKKTNIGRKRR